LIKQENPTIFSRSSSIFFEVRYINLCLGLAIG